MVHTSSFCKLDIMVLCYLMGLNARYRWSFGGKCMFVGGLFQCLSSSADSAANV